MGLLQQAATFFCLSRINHSSTSVYTVLENLHGIIGSDTPVLQDLPGIQVAESGFTFSLFALFGAV